jgi:formate/nitrite transporter FocA (FNT family)
VNCDLVGTGGGGCFFVGLLYIYIYPEDQKIQKVVISF